MRAIRHVLSMIFLAMAMAAADGSCQEGDYTLLVSDSDSQARLRVLTINVWSGVDYRGVLRFGEYETAERRAERFHALVRQIKEIAPDVVFVQEANPVARYAARLAEALSFDQVHQVVNAGIKFGPFGLPANFKEGIAILARPSLRLQKHDVWKLSGPFGVHGDAITIHLSEVVHSLVGRVFLNDTPVYLVNVHLVSSPPDDARAAEVLENMLDEGLLTSGRVQVVRNRWQKRTERRMLEVQRLLERLAQLPSGSPVVVAGDFNADPDSPEIHYFLDAGGFVDSYGGSGETPMATWDPTRNGNISRQTAHSDSIDDGLDDHGRFGSRVGAILQRRIDYVLLSRHFNSDDVLRSAVAIDSAVDGLQASDHFGFLVEVDMTGALRGAPQEPKVVAPLEGITIEPMPILMYDTDIEFGYGVKAFLLNPLNRNESFDFIAFNSTGGERWYRTVFSIPDFERRQGKVYPVSFDLELNYDKYISSRFFGIGNQSRLEDVERYTKELFEAKLTLGRGFSPQVAGQVGVKYRTVDNYNFAEGSDFLSLPPLNRSRVTYTSAFANWRHDTRDSFVNPTHGLVLQGELEYASDVGPGNISFGRYTALFQYYSVLFYPKTVFAMRLVGQGLVGEDLPVQVLLPIGGLNTTRGFPQDFYLGNVSALFNTEVRFPLWRRFGGVVGIDAGNVWNSPGDVGFRNWAVNHVVGLRFHFQTFVVRMDIGFGKDRSGAGNTGLYFNFGHIF